MPEHERESLKKPSREIDSFQWAGKVFQAINEICPPAPVSPDSPEFGWKVSEGEDPEELKEKWDSFIEKYTNDEGKLDVSDYAEWDKEIPCPSCESPILWGRAIGYNNHMHAACTGCNLLVRE